MSHSMVLPLLFLHSVSPLFSIFIIHSTPTQEKGVNSYPLSERERERERGSKSPLSDPSFEADLYARYPSLINSFNPIEGVVQYLSLSCHNWLVPFRSSFLFNSLHFHHSIDASWINSIKENSHKIKFVSHILSILVIL